MNTMKSKRMTFKLKYVAVVLGFVLMGCGNDDDGSPTPTPVDPEEPITASYNATFSTNFNETDFPQDYPANATFGTVVAIVHAPDVSVYQTGQLASEGFRAYLENGDVDALGTFIQNQVGEQNEGSFVIQSEGNVNAVGSNTFSLSFTPTRTRVTIIANLNPSPDWFVGVSSFDITDGNALIQNETVGLGPLDGGVNGADTYEGDAQVESAGISSISGAPFSDGGLVPQIGSIEFTRVN